MRKIKMPIENHSNNYQAEEKLRESKEKLQDAIKTKREVQQVRDQFARSLERAMRRTNG